VKSRARIILIIAALLLLTFLADRWRRAHLESSQDKNILVASEKYGVDPALIKAVIWQESRFDPDARGSKGEIGLMQIMDGTGRDWAKAQHVPLFSRFTLRDAKRNIDCGAWYLAKLLRRYPATDNPLPYALADYNAGRGNVLKWTKGSASTNSAVFMDEIGFLSTRSYVRAVMDRRLKYETQFARETK
jgi:soluble lytic murein transglycosylase